MKMFIAFNGLIAFTTSSRLRGIIAPSTDVLQAPTAIVAPTIMPTAAVTQVPVGTGVTSIAQVPTASVSQVPASIVMPMTSGSTASIAQVPTVMNPTYGYPSASPYPYPYPSQPSLSYLQSLLVQNGIQSLINKSVTTNNQNVVANTIASQGSNANTNMNNMAGSFTINGITVKPGDMTSVLPKLNTIPTTLTPTPTTTATTTTIIPTPTATIDPSNVSNAVILKPGASSTAVIQQPTGTLVIH